DGLCSSDTLVFKQDITKLGIWPKDSFNFFWRINGVSYSTLDSIKYKHNNGDSFQLQFSFTKKNDARCKGSLTKPVKLYTSPKDTLRVSICNGDSALIHGVYRKSSGHYDFNGSSYRQCDSFASVILDVKPQYKDTIRLSICAGDSVRIHGKFRKLSGTYLLDSNSIQGCDSLVWTFLQVHPKYFKSDTFKICQGDTLHRHNKSYSSQGIYLDTFKTAFGCDSVFQTNLFVLPVYNDSSQLTICQGDSAFIHGAWRKSGAYYTFNGSTLSACDSTSTIHLVVNPSYQLNQSFSICQGDSTSVHGQYRKSSGIYTFNGLTTLGCDSIVHVQLIVNPVYYFRDSFEICQGDTLRIHGRHYSSTGVFMDTFKTQAGCDSIFESNLMVHPAYNRVVKFGICSNDSFLFDGQYRFKSDTIVGRFNTVHGCDSVVTLILKVDSVIQTDVFPMICEGDSVFIGSSYRNSAGIYEDRYTAAKGCDSIVTRHLGIIKRDTSFVTFTLCQREVLNYHGHSYSDTGLYTVKLRSYRACDSIVFVRINKVPEIRTVINGSVCFGQGFFAGKSMKFGSGTFYDTLAAYSGCDSVVIYTQTERPRDSGYLSISICSNDSVFTGKSWKKLPGNYIDTLTNRFGCDSIVFTILSNRPVSAFDIFDTICHGETVSFNGNILSSSGIYKRVLLNYLGCDSVVSLHLYKRTQFVPRIIADGFSRLKTELPYSSYQWYVGRNILPGDTSRVVVVVQPGIYDVSVTDSLGCRANSWDDWLSGGSLKYDWPVQAYPCPADDILILKSTKTLSMEVFNSKGIRVLLSEISVGENNFNTADWPDGVYHIRVSDGVSFFTISVVILH
ncbi:MAG: T9SS type A sorting domain-containing protein, partial [Bacteroidetes bacterium]|nr:T9SS type A sorting domain-containing protein [Bacteroidota bacterium]